MSTRTVIIWLVVAVLLGATALLLLRQSGSAGGPGAPAGVVAAGQPVLEFDPAKVERVKVERPDGTSESIEREGSSDWVLRIRNPKRAGGEAGAPWPLTPSHVQGLLRVLSRTTAAAGAPADATLGAGPTVVTLELEGGGVAVLRLADRTLAGTGLVEVERSPGTGETGPARKRMALITDQIHNTFNQPGPRGWRDPAVFGDLSDVSRVTLSSKDKTLALAKLNGQWAIREPVSAPADPGAVSRLLGTLQGVRIADYLDDGDAGARTGLENPEASVTVETDRRTAQPGGSDQVTTSTDRQTLAIGTLGDAQGTRVFASLGGEDDARLVLVEARALGGLTMDPAAYAWPHPTRLAPPDVGTLVLERHSGGADPGAVYRRRLDKWVEVRPDGSEVALADADRRRPEALVEFLTGTGAAAQPADPARGGPTVVTFSPPDGYQPVGRVAVLSIGEAPLDAVEVGTSGQGSVTVRTGAVFRSYPVTRVPSVIAELVAPKAAPIDPSKPPEPSK